MQKEHQIQGMFGVLQQKKRKETGVDGGAFLNVTILAFVIRKWLSSYTCDNLSPQNQHMFPLFFFSGLLQDGNRMRWKSKRK
jgi:hypothetical protein